MGLDSEGVGNFFYIANLLLFIALIELVIVVLCVLLYLIISWLKSNWKLATKDAAQELKGVGRIHSSFINERRSRKK